MGELSVAVDDLSFVELFIEELTGRGVTFALVLKSLGILVLRRVIFTCILSSNDVSWLLLSPTTPSELCSDAAAWLLALSVYIF